MNAGVVNVDVTSGGVCGGAVNVKGAKVTEWIVVANGGVAPVDVANMNVVDVNVVNAVVNGGVLNGNAVNGVVVAVGDHQYFLTHDLLLSLIPPTISQSQFLPTLFPCSHCYPLLHYCYRSPPLLLTMKQVFSLKFSIPHTLCLWPVLPTLPLGSQERASLLC